MLGPSPLLKKSSDGNADEGGILLRYPEVSVRTRNPFPDLPGRQSKYFYTRPDATINYDRLDLFSHIGKAEETGEFAYGEPNRLGTQAGYLNVPHTVQRGLVPLVLPSPKEAGYGNEPFALGFPHLSKGDIAFYLRLQSSSWELVGDRKRMLSQPPLGLVCKDWGEAVRKRRRMHVPDGEVGRSLMMGEGSQVWLLLIRICLYLLTSCMTSIHPNIINAAMAKPNIHISWLHVRKFPTSDS